MGGAVRSGSPRRSRAPRRWTRPVIGAIMILVAVALVGLACGGREGASATSAEPRHLILITVDTWRADHFGGEVAGVKLTPHLAELAERSIRFTHATSVAALTSAGVAGILTGLLPERSGVVANDHMLPSSLPNLASLLAEQHFVSGAFIANPVLYPGYGFENGFTHYQAIRRQRPERKAKADAVNREALAWLDGISSGQRIFLWVHYMEPHGPYEPPEDHLALFAIEQFEAPTDIPLLPEGHNGGWRGIPHYQQLGVLPVTTDGREYLRRYAAEVHSLDVEVGELLDELERRDLLARSVLVIAADHGEALADDHGFYFSHDNGLTQDQIAVPLLIHYPGCPGKTVEQPVSNVDVLPTVLELLGARLPANLDGQSLLDERPDHVVSQSFREQTIRQGPWKLRAFKDRRAFILTDLSSDPNERHNLSAQHDERLRALQGALAEVRRKPALAPSISRKVDAEQRRQLEALGYL